MRQRGNLRLLLNANLWPKMPISLMDGGKVGVLSALMLFHGLILMIFSQRHSRGPSQTSSAWRLCVSFVAKMATTDIQCPPSSCTSAYSELLLFFLHRSNLRLLSAHQIQHVQLLEMPICLPMHEVGMVNT